MCFGPFSSIAAFVIGTLLNVSVALWLIRTWPGQYDHVVPMIVGLQFSLLMQLIEYYLWRIHERREPVTQASVELTFWLNMLQPLAFFACALWSRQLNGSLGIEHVTAFVIISFYYVAFLRHLFYSKSWDIMPKPDCNHIRLAWTSSEESDRYVYIIVLMAAIFMAPRDVAIPLAFILLVAKYLSMLVYPCSTGSLWCFSVAIMAPVLAFIVTAQHSEWW